MKLAFVCLLLGSLSPGLAQESSPWSGESVDVQRLFKFSGTLTDPHRAGPAGTLSVRFAMYNEPNGGEAYWQETQIVHPDAGGRYMVLLGETTVGGLPADIFASRGRHWLGVRAAGQPEQPRILLVELPSTWKADPINPSAPVSKRTILTRDPTERRLALTLLIMFLAGTVMACREVVNWWKARMEQYEPPPFANLIDYVPTPDRRWRATPGLRFPLTEKFRSIRERFQHSFENIDKDRPNKAA